MGAYEPLDCRVIVSVAIRNVSESYSVRSLKLTVTVLNRTGCMIAVPTLNLRSPGLAGVLNSISRY